LHFDITYYSEIVNIIKIFEFKMMKASPFDLVVSTETVEFPHLAPGLQNEIKTLVKNRRRFVFYYIEVVNLCILDAPAAPSAPQAGSVFRDSCIVTWSPPTTDGGSPVTGYQLEHRLIDRLNWVRADSSQLISGTCHRVTGLADGQSYQFRVAAENRVGLGDWSAASIAVLARDPWEKPGRPGPVQVSDVTCRSCKLSWVPPSSDGGDEIRGYVVEYKVSTFLINSSFHGI
jgi:titin